MSHWICFHNKSEWWSRLSLKFCLLSCSPEKKPYRFGAIWRYVKDDRISYLNQLLFNTRRPWTKNCQWPGVGGKFDNVLNHAKLSNSSCYLNTRWNKPPVTFNKAVDTSHHRLWGCHVCCAVQYRFNLTHPGVIALTNMMWFIWIWMLSLYYC